MDTFLNKCRLAVLNRGWIIGGNRRTSLKRLKRLTPWLPRSAHNAMAIRRITYFAMLVVNPACETARSILLSRCVGTRRGGRCINHFARTIGEDLVFVTGQVKSPMNLVQKLIDQAETLKKRIENEIDIKGRRPTIPEMWTWTRARALKRRLRRSITSLLRDWWANGAVYRATRRRKHRRQLTIPCESIHCRRLFARISEMNRHVEDSHRGPEPRLGPDEAKCPVNDCRRVFKKKGGHIKQHLKFHVI